MNNQVAVSPNNQVKLCIGTPLKQVPPIFILQSILAGGYEEKKNLWNFFQGTSQGQKFDFIKIVNDPAQADFVILPHNYFILKKALGDKKGEYLAAFVSLAKKYNKKILVLALADSDEDIDIENAIVFRQSQYGYKMKANEIMMPFYTSPTYSPAFMPQREKIWNEIILRNKTEKPTVSFCGWAGFPSFYRTITYGTRVFWADVQSRVFRNKYAELHKSGIYFRRKAINALEKTHMTTNNFIIRQSYSAQKGMDGIRKISPEEAEKQYVENMINSDFVLSPKGNGNGSIRFYEALSLGRLPVLINTDCILPLADKINYKDFVVSVDYHKIADIGRQIKDFYDLLTDDGDLHRRQYLARKAFELLRPDSFFQETFLRLKSLN